MRRLAPWLVRSLSNQLLGDWCSDPEIRTALNDAVAILGELLHGFNEVIYKTYVQPNQGD
jgi:hypothetical protein